MRTRIKCMSAPLVRMFCAYAFVGCGSKVGTKRSDTASIGTSVKYSTRGAFLGAFFCVPSEGIEGIRMEVLRGDDAIKKVRKRGKEHFNEPHLADEKAGKEPLLCCWISCLWTVFIPRGEEIRADTQGKRRNAKLPYG